MVMDYDVQDTSLEVSNSSKGVKVQMEESVELQPHTHEM